MAILALFAGGPAGMKIAEWASRYGSQEAPISRPELAARSPGRARAALAFPLFAGVLWIVGGVLTIRMFLLLLLPGRMAVAVLFALVSMSCILGLARGAYEALLALGPAVDQRAPWHLGFDLKYFDATPGLRLRGALRLFICSSVMGLLVALSLFLGPR